MNLSQPQYERLYQRTLEALVRDVEKLEDALECACTLLSDMTMESVTQCATLLRTRIPLLCRVSLAHLDACIEYRRQLDDCAPPRVSRGESRSVLIHTESVNDAVSILLHARLSAEAASVIARDLAHEHAEDVAEFRTVIHRITTLVRFAERMWSTADRELSDEEKDEDEGGSDVASGGGAARDSASSEESDSD